MIWNPRSLLHQQTKYSATPPIQQIFLPPRFWVVTWPAATRVFLPTTKEGREERPWERGCTVPLFLCALFFFSSVPLCLLILCASVPTVRPRPFPILLRGYCSWWRQSGRRTRATSQNFNACIQNKTLTKQWNQNLTRVLAYLGLHSERKRGKTIKFS